MARKHKRQLGSRNYKNYTEETLLEAVNAVSSKKLSLRKAALQFGIHYNTLHNKLKKKHTAKVGRASVFTEEEENVLAAYLISMSTYGFPMTVFDLRCVVSAYLGRIGKKVPQFKNNFPGRDWAYYFLKRQTKFLSQRLARNITHNRAGTNEEVLNNFFANLEKELEGIPSENIWNYDETNLVDDPGSHKVITRRGAKYPERIRNSSKACTSIMMCGSAAGELAPVYVNYKADHLWSTWTENGPPTARYNRTHSGWFDYATFEDWFEKLMLPILKEQHGKKVLIGDNLSSHINTKVVQLCEENEILFIALPPNSTHLLQPLDVAFFRPLKEAWRVTLNKWKETPAGSRCTSIPKASFPSLLQDLLERIQPNAASNLKAGFNKCGIFPLNKAKPMSTIPKNVLEQEEDFNGVISTTFLEHLESKRQQVTQPIRKKRKRLNVVPGKSFSPSDLAAPSTSNANDFQPSTSTNTPVLAKKNGKKGKQKKKKLNFDSDTSDSDSAFRPQYQYEQSDSDLRSVESDSFDDKEPSRKKKAPLQYIVGDYVLVNYEGELYPGKVTALGPSKTFKVSAMVQKGRHWIWPKCIDEINYKIEDMKGLIEEPKQIGCSERFSVPELEALLV